jgi:hypothetical protein
MKPNRDAAFYKILLPVFTVANLGLGVMVLSQLQPKGELGWLEVGTGAFCCLVAGWLAAAGWSRAYWGVTMTKQVSAWHRMVDAIFGWIEELPVSPEAMNKLKRSLDEALVKNHTRT